MSLLHEALLISWWMYRTAYNFVYFGCLSCDIKEVFVYSHLHVHCRKGRCPLEIPWTCHCKTKSTSRPMMQPSKTWRSVDTKWTVNPSGIVIWFTWTDVAVTCSILSVNRGCRSLQILLHYFIGFVSASLRSAKRGNFETILQNAVPSSISNEIWSSELRLKIEREESCLWLKSSALTPRIVYFFWICGLCDSESKIFSLKYLLLRRGT